MKILYVLPRNMYFGARQATSIDLCCRDLISASAYRASTGIVAPRVVDFFEGFDTVPFPAAGSSTRRRAAYAAALAGERQPDLIVVEQHLPSAAALARKVEIPVVLHRHNFQKRYETGTLLDRARRWFKLRSYLALSGIIHVSHACDAQFGLDWPEVAAPRAVVPNSLAFSQWRPAAERAHEILCVGRCAPEKGILEAAEALAMALPILRGWRARLILAEVGVHPAYHKEVLAALGSVAERVTIEVQLPFPEVQAANERAAIALIPSKWQEPFGRTALEAHAGGAAVISSGSGGLREVSGDGAMFVGTVAPRPWADAITLLAGDAQPRETLARHGREHALRHFNCGAVSARADAFFERICGCPAADRSRVAA